jgi:hypothetical protein
MPATWHGPQCERRLTTPLLLDSSASRLLNFSTKKPREQSENVYENKGKVQNVAES